MAKEGPGPKLIRMAVVLVPAAIFFGYYLASLHHRHAPPRPLAPPALTVEAGARIQLGAYSFQARQPLFTPSINEPDNTILAGPSQVFVIVPVVIRADNRPARPAGLTWQLVDDSGDPHQELTPQKLLVPPALAAPSLQPVYLVFRLPDSSQKPFLLLTSPAGQAAWRLPRPT